MTRLRQGLIDCGEDKRRGMLASTAHPLNGIDFVEYTRTPGTRQLTVTFVKARPASPVFDKSHFSITGGIRITGITVESIVLPAAAPKSVILMLSAEGDFSTYAVGVQHPAVDMELSEVSFGFKAACPSPFDCRSDCDCTEAAVEEPALDYLARDYQSFRRMLLDFVSARNTAWTERLPSDLGVSLVELFAYVGDYLSYFQDAAATEAYLDTALHRVSVKRHTRLVDYPMHDGANARTYVHLNSVSAGIVDAGTRLCTRIARPLTGATDLPGTVIPKDAGFAEDPALSDVVIFETEAELPVRPELNELRIHTFGNGECCLGAGCTDVHLYHLSGDGHATRPSLVAGDLLLLEEVRSARTGEAVDRNASHRWVVELVEVSETTDEALTDLLAPRLSAADAALPLLRVRWSTSQALPEAVQISAIGADLLPIDPVTVARGNIVVADHGLTIFLDSARGELDLPAEAGSRYPLATLDVPASPLTQTTHGPAIELLLSAAGQEDQTWSAVPDLFDSTPYARDFVAEVSNDGAPTLRFGDDIYGRMPRATERAQLTMRIGNGSAGNIGSGSIFHIAAAAGVVDGVYQPLSATGGTDPQSTAEVKRLAPAAFRAEQFRAVTENDWRDAALRHMDVLDARAVFGWTGSWHTIFVAIHPRDERDLLPMAGGGFALESRFAGRIYGHLRRFKLAGYDLAVTSAVYVPIEIAMTLCIARGYFPGDVAAAVQKTMEDFFGQLGARFGKPVYLSEIYAAIEPIEGLESANVTRFKRYWEPQRDWLDRGVIDIGAFEIARLDNNLSAPEFGVLVLETAGAR
ncbi:hypothetical protein [Rhizobium grahamii]|uniref:Baseplate assembly protein n=1 Tax=Rhizobium grahamii TaxID=1120045 RepID=A0A370KGP8_9HYPH|nr:hypothetical protein [Rhizobium grahamii]RDJ03952.1 hypothetical protein B5K06_29045 [Rhizobium grahamii]